MCFSHIDSQGVQTDPFQYIARASSAEQAEWLKIQAQEAYI